MPSRPATSPRRRRRWAAGIGLVLLVLAFLAQTPPRERVEHFVEHRPSVIAHGGAQGHAPPNTIEAFALALELGADVLEMDTQITADGAVVTHHDGTVDRQTDGSGEISELTVAEVQQLDAGHGFVAEDGQDWTGRGVRIPTLDEVLATFPDAFLVIELKLDGGTEIVEAVAERIEAADAADRVVVASFGLEEIRLFRERMPDVPTSMPEGETRAFYMRQLVGLHRWWTPPAGFLQVPEYHEGRHVVTPRFVGAAERLGVDVHVWTVNDPEDMRRFVDMGVQGIITDYPDRLVAVLEDLPQPVAPAPGLQEVGLGVIRWSQEHLGWLTGLALAVTHLGDAEFYLLVFPLLYWSVHPGLGLRMGLLLLLSSGLNAVAKLGVVSPRPYFLDPSVGRVVETSLGIPSGHAQNGAALWGLLAHDVRRRWAYAAAGVLVLALGLSRIHLGAHFPEDVVLGWAVGGLLLLAFVRWSEPAAAWLVDRSPSQQVGAALAVSTALILAGALVRTGLTGWAFPAAWVGATSPGLEEGALGLGDVVTRAGALFGLAAGVVALRARGGFDSGGPTVQRLLRYLVGLAGTVLLWLGFGAVVPDGEAALPLALGWLHYAAIGAWIGGGAPLLFVRLGLAARPAVAAAERQLATRA